MWIFLLGLLTTYAMNYVCSSDNNKIHYYSDVSYPLPNHPLHKIAYCYKECSPCVLNDTYNVMIGHRATCNPTMEQQIHYKLINSTTRTDYSIDTKPFTGIYHSYATLPFISHSYLCVYYPEEDMIDDETTITYSSTSIHPKRLFNSPL